MNCCTKTIEKQMLCFLEKWIKLLTHFEKLPHPLGRPVFLLRFHSPVTLSDLQCALRAEWLWVSVAVRRVWIITRQTFLLPDFKIITFRETFWNLRLICSNNMRPLIIKKKKVSSAAAFWPLGGRDFLLLSGPLLCQVIRYQHYKHTPRGTKG